MRFWTWIPVFFLLQYSYCGQTDPSFEAEEDIPANLTVLAQVQEGLDIFGVSITIDGELQTESAPFTVELVSGRPYEIRVEKEDWVFDPAVETITLGPLEDRELIFTGSSALPRIVLLEDFSNHGCVPCPAADEAMWEAVGIASGPALPIAWHVNYPTPGDPFYFYQPYGVVMNNARSGPAYYAVVSVPHIRVDGEAVATPSSSENILSFVEPRLSRSRLLDMSIARVQTQSDVTITVEGSLEVNLGEDEGWRLFIVLYETLVHYDAPNEQTEFRNTVRHCNGEDSGTLGEPIALTPGGSFEQSVTFAPTFGADSPAEVDADKVRALAFVQHDVTFEVLDLVVEENGGP